MLRRVIGGTKKAFGLHHPGRNFDVFPDDIFILSFPKSGNTWTRFLIANFVYPETPADFSNINQLTPNPEGTTKRDLARAPRPRIIKSHQYFHPDYKRVIYIVRDPRDVAVSQFHFQRKRKVLDDNYPIEKFVSRFVAGDTGPYGSWGENVASWLSTRYNRPGFLLLRYEDMLADTPSELAKVAEFLGIPPDPKRIETAVQRSSAENMRKLEKAQAKLWTTTKDTRQDVPFVRAAKAGGWRETLSEAAIAEIEGAWGHIMNSLGYKLHLPDRGASFDSRFAEPLLNGPSR
jgi:hypothetical protein